MIPGLLGGLLGLFGSAVTKGISLYEKKLEIEDAKNQRKHELDLFDKQIALRGQEREHEETIVGMQTATAERVASYQQDASYGTDGVVALIRFVRPAITVLLMALVAVMYFTTGDIVVGETSMKAQIAAMVVEYLGMAIAWWFGDRQQDKKK